MADLDWLPTVSETSKVKRWTAPENEVVWTKIDDENGERNIVKLYRSRNLWFLPDHSMYVYYMPTHWASVSNGMLAPEGE